MPFLQKLNKKIKASENESFNNQKNFCKYIKAHLFGLGKRGIQIFLKSEE